MPLRASQTTRGQAHRYTLLCLFSYTNISALFMVSFISLLLFYSIPRGLLTHRVPSSRLFLFKWLPHLLLSGGPRISLAYLGHVVSLASSNNAVIRSFVHMSFHTCGDLSGIQILRSETRTKGTCLTLLILPTFCSTTKTGVLVSPTRANT